MDKDVRNILQRATQDARGLLEEEYREQLEGVFDILLDGTIDSEPGSHLDDAQRLTRQKLVAAVEHNQASGITADEAVAMYLREAAFTTLNRFAALKMLEARELVQECISKGEQSAGFKEFCVLAPGLASLSDKGYRLYIENIFDEIGREVRVLFNRQDAVSLLWPRRQAFNALLDILNQQDLTSVWAEDETIGWVYQYFNSQEERRQMRNESSAPRNSRELAVRNQFFTPRYVVEFLTDNTLGRIWYEMRQGNTILKDQCRYLVRRPNEIFLKVDEAVPENEQEATDNLSQEELLRQPVHIPFRPKKDPREIRMLDPAGGSGHFGLYCFDLFLVIYAEAYDDEDLGPALKKDYPDRTVFLNDVPRLILAHNIHIIDIDPRAVQIAGLALWLRAQRAYNDMSIPRAQRPPITRTNVVVAEPMPGEKDMFEEFLKGLREDRLENLMRRALEIPPDRQVRATKAMADSLCALARTVWESMSLAGEAGSLLKIEDDIAQSVRKSRATWEDKSPLFRFTEFSLEGKTIDRYERFLDGDENDFWESAEQLVLAAIREFAERTFDKRTISRRLFADDAARGFALIDLCRKRYDTVLMNPPFGDRVLSCEQIFERAYGNGRLDLYHYFYERAELLLSVGGRVGAITPRTSLYQAHYTALREKWLEKKFRPQAIAELDLGVLDNATVRPVLVVLGESSNSGRTFYKNLKYSANPGPDLYEAVSRLCEGRFCHGTTYHNITRFRDMPGKRISLWATENILNAFSQYDTLEPVFGKVTEGLSNEDDMRFLRCWWEPPAASSERWRPFGKFNSRSTFISDFSILIDWSRAGYAALGELGNRRANEAYYFKDGLAFTRSCEVGMAATTLPSGVVFAGTSRYFLPKHEPKLGMLAYLNTRLVEGLHLVLTPDRDRISGTLRRIPVVVDNTTLDNLSAIAHTVWQRKMSWIISTDETHRQFVGPSANVADKSLRDWSSVANAFKRDIYALEELIEEKVGQSVSFTKEDLSILAEEVKARAGERDLVTWNQDLTKSSAGAAVLIAAYLGMVFGRWDVRIASNQSLVPKLPDPFGVLPVCPPGMLIGPDGMPATPNHIVSEEWLRARPDANALPLEGVVQDLTVTDADYPLRVSWLGILVDDPGHPEDISGRVQEVFTLLLGDNADEQIREAEEILGLKQGGLRDWFRRDFFLEHIKRYSKTRRKAPIYWQLATPSVKYSVWVYYHRFTKDTFYKVLNDYVAPKVRHEERKLTSLLQEYGATPASSQRKEIADQETFVEELRAFRDEVARIAPLWNPDLNDGVLINSAPLWRLVPQHRVWQKKCKECWDKLVKGEHDWAHLAMHLWPERVVPKCAEDRSLAITHDLEEVFWEEGTNGKWKPKKVSKDEIARLVQERTSASVRAALNDLLSAPGGMPAPKKRAGRKKRA